MKNTKSNKVKKKVYSKTFNIQMLVHIIESRSYFQSFTFILNKCSREYSNLKKELPTEHIVFNE